MDFSTANFSNKRTMMGILVHEYHHFLMWGSGHTYADEFMAHWKQFEVTKGPAREADTKRAQLVHDRLVMLYKQHVDHYERKGNETPPTGLSNMPGWKKYKNNKGTPKKQG